MARAPRPASLTRHRWLTASIIVGAIALVGVSFGLLRLLPLGSRATTGVPQLVFAAFGQTADLVYVAPATNPEERTIIDTVQHAEGWGINPGAMSGNLIAFNVIPTGTPAQRGAPSELWLLDAKTKEKTRLARDADLLVKPQFVSGGKAILYRRSVGGVTTGAPASTSGAPGASGATGPGGIASDVQAIVRVDIETQARTVLHEEPTAFGILPVGIDGSGALLFARLSNNGTDVFSKRGNGAPTLAFHASDEIARDWQLSPDGKSLAYLAPQPRAERVVNRAQVVSIEAGRPVTLPDADGNGEQYGPTWTPDGADLAVGQEALGADRAAVALLRPGAQPSSLAGPAKGFDVPVAWSADRTYLAARTFDGQNSTNAGRETAVVIARSGERYAVSAPGEVILVGWLNA